MKAVIRFISPFLLVLFFFSPSWAKPVKLTYSNFFPPTHVQSVLAQEWCDAVEKRTQGRVKVEYYPGQTLTKAKQNYDGVVTGVSDIGMCLLAYTRGRFPVMEAVDLPLGYKSGMAATQVVNAVYAAFKPKELMDTQVMYLHAHGAGLLHTKGRAVRTMADFKGLKIRGHGTSAQVISALGGTPVSLPMPELYSSLQKGVVQGALYPVEVNKGWRMGEVSEYMTLNTSIAYTSSFYVVMNRAKWEALAPDIQEIIQGINQEWILRHGRAWDESDRVGLEYFKSLGHEVIELPQSEAAQWRRTIEPVIGKYIQKMEKRGFEGSKIVSFVRNSLAQHQ